MKTTGIVRRIDDLGRIMIPKTIREQLYIQEGEPFEIFTVGNDTVIFKKYRPIEAEKMFLEAANMISNAIDSIYESKKMDKDYQLLKSFAYYINSNYKEVD